MCEPNLDLFQCSMDSSLGTPYFFAYLSNLIALQAKRQDLPTALIEPCHHAFDSFGQRGCLIGSCFATRKIPFRL
jgi:hypothetical protein